MLKKVIFILVLALLLGCSATAYATADQLYLSDPEWDESREIDFVLVSKTTKLPENWEERVELALGGYDIEDGDALLVERVALKHFLALRTALLREGIDIELDSTYRSVAAQQAIWDDWSNDPELGLEYCEKYLAVPGYSEHHTGLAIDIYLVKNGEIIRDNDAMIAETEIFARIHEVMPDYGFILRYPEGKEDITGYAYEPWHLRYIGPNAAKIVAMNDWTLEELLQTK